MKKYEYVTGINGGNKPYILRMKLSENVDVVKGQLVYYDKSKQRVTPTAGSDTVIAGVCANTYKAEPSELCPEYKTGMIDVIVSPDAVYKTDPIIITDRGSYKNNGIMTSILDSENTVIDSFIGAKVILIEKGLGSTNQLAVGEEIEIESIIIEDGFITFRLPKVTTGSKGDKYIFVPNFGFNLFRIDEDGSFAVDFDNSGENIILDANDRSYYVHFKDVYLGNF